MAGRRQGNGKINLQVLVDAETERQILKLAGRYGTVSAVIRDLIERGLREQQADGGSDTGGVERD
jgi:hypothetical protein